MAAIPIRLPPLPGEALDSWLEAYADLLHVTVRDIFAFAGVDWDRLASEAGRPHKLWLYRLDEPDLIALSAVTGVPAATLAGMTLARYQGTGLAEAAAEPGRPRTPRWWRQLTGSRYCPRCLAANGGRWMLAWRIPWTFACTSCQALLADTCPDCGRRHQRTRTGQPRRPGRCDLTGLPLPPWRPRGGTVTCTSDPVGAPSVALPAGGHVLAAQQHADALISALLASRGRPAETAALQQQLDDIHAVARAAASALTGTAAPPAAATAVLAELSALPGPGTAASALTRPAGGPRRQLAPVTAFGVTIADIMLHGRPGDPDPVIAGWLAGNTASRRSTSSPADVLIHWDRASPALQAALARPLASRLDTFYQLRYRAIAGPARIPGPVRAGEGAPALPSLLWPGWALRLMPPEGFDLLRCRTALAIMLAVAVTGAEDYRAAQELLGLDPFHSSRLATFTARLREHSILEPVTAALCQLARKLEENGAPVDYARRRRLRRFSQPRLDTVGWRRQRYFLTRPTTWAERRHLDHASLPAAAPVQEQFARLRLIELLTGTHPRYLPEPLRLPDRRSQDYAGFVFTMPEQMARCLHQQARSLLAHAGIGEPVTWEPPFDWAAGIPWPGPAPDAITPGDLHPLIRAGLPVRAIATRLGTTADHVRLTAARHPAPQLPAGGPAQSLPEPELPGTGQLRALTEQGYGARKIARITGCSERTIRQLLTGNGLRHPAPPPDGSIDPQWLREQYQDRQRSLKDIAAETGTPVEALAAAARKADIRVRHGINARAHPLTALGGPGAFPLDIWTVFTHPGAEQRIRRLLAVPGQPGLHQAARQLGIRNAILTSQVRQLEAAVGTALLRTRPDGRLTLTAYGQLFARDVRPALESLAQSRKSKDDNHGTLPRAPPGTVHLPGNQPAESCSTTTKRPAHAVQVHAIPTRSARNPSTWRRSGKGHTARRSAGSVRLAVGGPGLCGSCHLLRPGARARLGDLGP